MTNKLLPTGLACAALALAACASTVAGHGTTTTAAAGPSGFPSSSSAPTSPAGPNASRPATELEQAAEDAVRSATAFHLKGSGDTGAFILAFDIHYGATSSDGHLSVDSTIVKIRWVKPDVWMNGSRAFWEKANEISGDASVAGSAAVIDQLADKWVHIPAGASGLSDLAALADREQFSAQTSNPAATYSSGPAKTVNGIPAVSFVDSTDGSIVYVPATGTPYPIRIEDHGSNAGTLDLSAWNVPFSAPRPPASEVVELPH